MTKSPEVFVILTGVSGNLGDAVIRRRVLEWSRGLGPIHAYLGRTTAGWAEQLQLHSDERAYTASRRREWLKRLVFGRGGRVLVFDPGEVPLGRAHLKSEMMFLGVVLAVRLRGGVVFRPPRAIGEYDRTVGWFYRMSSRLTQVILWRDAESLERVGVGKLSPDTAFGEPSTSDAAITRDLLLVSMRGKRSMPPTQWFSAVAAYASEAGLRIVTVSQVDEDEDRNRELANALGENATFEPWGDRSDFEQEKLVRDYYTRCAIVISDRLHVLILSAQAGAIPVELAESPKAKVRTHFATIGMDDVSLDASGKTTAQLVDFLRANGVRQRELEERLAAARTELDAEVNRFRALVAEKAA